MAAMSSTSLVVVLSITVCFSLFTLSSGADVSLTTPAITYDDDNSSSSCRLNLANNQTYATLRQKFQSLATGGVVCVVYFNLKTQTDAGDVVPFSVSGPDTFAGDSWVWATSKGRSLLRMPLDNAILSLGLLTINTFSMDVLLDASSTRCLETKPYDYVSHKIAKYIAENITANGTTVGLYQDGPVVCRSAFAFTHRIYGEKGIGFKCCSAPIVPGDRYICDSSFSANWELVWYGPVALMCWIYLIAAIHFYRIYRRAFALQKVRQISGLEHTIHEIKLDIVKRILRMSERLTRIKTPEALLALREPCNFLDILGVGKVSHSLIIRRLRFLFVIFLLLSYYGVCIIFLHQYYRQLKDVLVRLDTQSAFINVIGRIGWVFCRHDVGVFPYAVFELIYTALMPVLAIIVYFSITFWSSSPITSSKTSEVVVPLTPSQRFARSRCGKCLQALAFALTLIYILFVAGVFLAYVVYFVGLGLLANIDVVSPWVIPLVICIHFFATSFDSAYAEYKLIKDLSFSICLDKFNQLIIKRHKELFLPREMIENFYIPNSRSTIYSCFFRILWVFAFVLLLILVVLTLQYPYYHQTSSIVSFLGVQMVLVIPYLTKYMYSNSPLSSLEEGILKRDITGYITKFITEHPDVEKLQEQNKEYSDAEFLVDHPDSGELEQL